MKQSVKFFGIPLNKRTAVRWKIYLDRARMYLGYINFVMLVVIFLNSFENEWIRELLDLNKWMVYPAVMVLFVFISLLLGRLDTSMGLRKEEMRNNASENPVTMEILNKLEKIEKRL
ncbi:MAG: hypothetical protein JXQ90_01340 [Cyclobacteriaceae bacterium]